jgi:flagellar hook-basal body complex protein FliE
MNINSTVPALSKINPLQGLQQNEATPKAQNESFANVLNKAIKSVDGTQKDAYKAMNDIATGKVTNLQQAVTKIEQAELSMKLALEVKNKAIAAYKEIIKMQV